jgi:hypothetical protein
MGHLVHELDFPALEGLVDQLFDHALDDRAERPHPAGDEGAAGQPSQARVLRRIGEEHGRTGRLVVAGPQLGLRVEVTAGDVAGGLPRSATLRPKRGSPSAARQSS